MSLTLQNNVCLPVAGRAMLQGITLLFWGVATRLPVFQPCTSLSCRHTSYSIFKERLPFHRILGSTKSYRACRRFSPTKPSSTERKIAPAVQMLRRDALSRGPSVALPVPKHARGPIEYLIRLPVVCQPWACSPNKGCDPLLRIESLLSKQLRKHST
jgi:hypothetical protein